MKFYLFFFLIYLFHSDIFSKENIFISLLKKDKYICIGTFVNNTSDTIFIPEVYHSLDSLHIYNSSYPLLQPVSVAFFQEGQYWVYEDNTDKLFLNMQKNRFKSFFDSGGYYYYDFIKVFPGASYSTCIVFEKNHLAILRKKKHVSFEIMYLINNKLIHQKYNNIKINRAK